MSRDKRLQALEQRYKPKGARLEIPFLRELCIESGGDPDNYFSPLAGMSDAERAVLMNRTLLESTDEYQ